MNANTAKTSFIADVFTAAAVLAFIPAVICGIVAAGISAWADHVPVHPPIDIIERTHQPDAARVVEIPPQPTKHIRNTLYREFHVNDRGRIRASLIADVQNAGGRILSQSPGDLFFRHNRLELVVPESYVPRLKALFDPSATPDYRDWIKSHQAGVANPPAADVSVEVKIGSYVYERRWLRDLTAGLLIFAAIGIITSIGTALSDP